MDQCTGAEILEETLRQLRFDAQLDAIMASSICVPCYLPYVNNVWLPWSRGDMPSPVPEGATNLYFARRGKQFAPCSSAAPRRHRFIRASSIRRRCSRR